jgi:hypothetical protein
MNITTGNREAVVAFVGVQIARFKQPSPEVGAIMAPPVSFTEPYVGRN